MCTRHSENRSDSMNNNGIKHYKFNNGRNRTRAHAHITHTVHTHGLTLAKHTQNQTAGSLVLF